MSLTNSEINQSYSLAIQPLKGGHDSVYVLQLNFQQFCRKEVRVFNLLRRIFCTISFFKSDGDWFHVEDISSGQFPFTIM